MAMILFVYNARIFGEILKCFSKIDKMRFK